MAVPLFPLVPRSSIAKTLTLTMDTAPTVQTVTVTSTTLTEVAIVVETAADIVAIGEAFGVVDVGEVVVVLRAAEILAADGKKETTIVSENGVHKEKDQVDHGVRRDTVALDLALLLLILLDGKADHIARLIDHRSCHLRLQ